jgi:hypothetical protein
MASRVERVHVALETVGLTTIAVGSVVLAVAELGPWWFDLVVAIIVSAAVYLVCACKIRELWRAAHETQNHSTKPRDARTPGADSRGWGIFSGGFRARCGTTHNR